MKVGKLHGYGLREAVFHFCSGWRDSLVYYALREGSVKFLRLYFAVWEASLTYTDVLRVRIPPVLPWSEQGVENRFTSPDIGDCVSLLEGVYMYL